MDTIVAVLELVIVVPICIAGYWMVGQILDPFCWDAGEGRRSSPRWKHHTP